MVLRPCFRGLRWCGRTVRTGSRPDLLIGRSSAWSPCTAPAITRALSFLRTLATTMLAIADVVESVIFGGPVGRGPDQLWKRLQ